MTQRKRDRIKALLDAGETQTEIGKIVKTNQSTISREGSHQNQDGVYDPEVAQRNANVKRCHSKYQGMKVEKNPDLKAHVIVEIMKKRSPDEIAGRMKVERMPFYASKNAIYQWLYSVYGEKYCKYLCTKRKRRRSNKDPASKRVMILNRIGIALRPLGAANKTRYGHWEGDTAVAPRKVPNNEGTAIAVERMSRFLVGAKILNQSPTTMTEAIQNMKRQTTMLSMTLDNGIENKHHEQWGIPTFFADPHAPWQKPLVEQSIGLLRRWFFPKGTDWAKVSEEEWQSALLFLNMKYRKVLKYQNALEVARAHKIVAVPKED